MPKIISSLLFISLVACSSPPKSPMASASKDYFPKARGCFILYNMKTNTLDKVIGEPECQERLPACSTFKVPLAVMAFDSGVLSNEDQVLKWDGKKRDLPQWNKDHNAKTWMKDSVVWFSQKVTPELGAKRFQKYLDSFNYGNKDFSTGLTTAWLNSPSDPRGGLKISAYEQIEFMKKLWRDQLPVSERAMKLAREITFIETSPKGFVLSGKTGSNSYDAEKKMLLGWFISHVQKGDQEYLAVTNFSDLAPNSDGGFGGPKARDITKAILADQGLW